MVDKRPRVNSPAFPVLLIGFLFLSLLYAGDAGAVCTRNAPSIIFTPTSGVAVFPSPGNKIYDVAVTNNDKEDVAGDCGAAVTFTVSVYSNSGDTGSFASPNPALFPGSVTSITTSLGVGQRAHTTLTVTTSASPVEGAKLITVLRATEALHPSGYGSVVTKASTVKGDGMILKRAQEEMCHVCHRTDRNTKPSDAEWGTAIKTHNSNNLGSAKWGTSGWGVAGGKYGQFVCTTCHTAHSTRNIYIIKELVGTPDGSNWGSTNSQWLTVDFRWKSSAPLTVGVMGDDTNTHSTSIKICEVCHSQTSYHKYNQTTVDHNNAADCTTSCHSHKVAFSGGGACDGCHGAPPGSGTDTNAPAQYAASHAQHYTGPVPSSYTDTSNNSTPNSYVIGCARCHNAQGTNTHNTSKVSPPPISVFVTLKAGEWFTRGANWMTNAGPPGSRVFYNFDSKCSNVYCHGNFPGGTAGNVPVWGSSSTGNCGTCHGASRAAWPTGGSHQAHISTVGGVMLSCNTCHKDTASGFTTVSNRQLHVNEKADWNLDSTNNRISTIGQYKGYLAGTAGWGTTGGPYGQCSNIYCHSTAQGANGTWPPTYSTPTWGSAGSGACGTCHNIGAAPWLTSGSHTKHIMKYSYTNCTSYCHSGAGDGTAKHADRNIDVAMSATYGGSYSQLASNPPGNGFGSCLSVYCHSTGLATPTYITTPWWGTASTGACGTCHGANNITPPASTLHAQHVSTVARYQFACSMCHNLTVTSTANSAAIPTISSTTLHVNNVKNVAFNGFNPIGTFTGGKCSQIYCHSDGTTVATGGTPMSTVGWSGTLGCNGCHGTTGAGDGRPNYPSYSTKANSHIPHLAYTCDVCHFATTSNGTTITSVGNHVNKIYNLLWKTSVGNYGTFAYTYAASGGTCSGIQCHNGTSAVWGSSGSASMDCIGCHSTSKAKTKYGSGTIGNYGSLTNRSGWTTMLRNVVGNAAGSDFYYTTFTLASRHLMGIGSIGQITKWDCIICHREGVQAGSSWASGHKDGRVHLRNVDTINQDAGWSIDNRAWNTYDYANLDNFCMSCHDANGASRFAVNATNNGIDTTGLRALTPFNTNDTASGKIRGSTEQPAAARIRVVNVKDQFYAGTGVGAAYNGNPSQHAVIGKRYSTVSNTGWGSSAWATFTTLKKMGQNQRVARETALLTCADCHVIDAKGGAHGGNSAYNLWTSGLGAAAPSAFQHDTLCWKCHASAVYTDTSAIAGSRFTHSANTDCGNVDNTRQAYGFGNPANKPCLLCHAGWNGTTTVTRQNSYGGIHGSWSSTAWYTSAAGQTTAYRFFPGTWYRVSRGSSDASWNTTMTNPNCYFWSGSAVQGWTNCNSHSNQNGTGSQGGASSYNRPVKY